MNRCKILFLAANPAGTNPLALDEESRQIEQRIRAAEHRDSLELITKWAVHPDDLLQYLNQYRPHVVHFSGHGTDTDQILLADDARQVSPVSAAALRQLFTILKDNVRVVVLNACYSQAQAQAIVEVIDCAVGMKRAIGDQAAIAFSGAFYGAIGFGRSAQDAFDQGKTALMLHGIPEEDTPTLVLRKGVDPRRLFIVEEERPAEEPPPVKAPDSEVEIPAPTPGTLNEILPGTWQVQIQTQIPGMTGQMRVELLPTGLFRGELRSPMGMSVVEGQWQANPFTRQIGLQGRQVCGFQVGPYVAMVQVTAFDPQQVVGVTSAGEQVVWQRQGPLPISPTQPARPPRIEKTPRPQPPKIVSLNT